MEVINTGINRLTALVRNSDVVGYDEMTGEGTLRYAQLSVDRGSDKIQYTIVVREENEQVLRLAREVQRGEECHSVWVHANGKGKHSNSVFDYEGGEMFSSRAAVKREVDRNATLRERPTPGGT
jgi:hypothetical protein